MEQPVMWAIAGLASVGIAVPTHAAISNSPASPALVTIPSGSVATPSTPTSPTAPDSTTATSASTPTVSVSVPSASVPDNTAPGNSSPGNSAPGNSAPDSPLRGSGSVADDISGPCDEAEHANDPQCTGAAPTGDGNSGHGGGGDD